MTDRAQPADRRPGAEEEALGTGHEHEHPDRELGGHGEEGGHGGHAHGVAANADRRWRSSPR
jgi:hypothetical protein